MRNLIITIILLFALQAQAQFCGSSGSTTSIADYIAGVEVTYSNHSSGNDYGYGNYTGHTFYGLQGQPVPLRLTPSNLSKNYMWYIWVDLDQSNSFEEEELVYSSTYPFVIGHTGVLEDHLVLPASAETGTSRMRVQLFDMAGTLPTPDPCRSGGNGEVQDYMIDIDGYCRSKGIAFGIDSYYYINSTTINGSTTPSDLDLGYGDFTHHTTIVERGATLSLDLDGERFDWHSGGEDYHWRIFLDFNGDFDFDDAGESYTIVSTDDFFGTLNIPSNAALGAIRMRLQFGIYTNGNACLDDFHGETEDYTLVIKNADTACELTIENSTQKWITQIGIGDLAIETSHGHGYDLTLASDPFFTAGIGTSTPFNFEFDGVINPIALTPSWAFWIDLNENGSFENSELMNASGYNGTGSFTIPSGTSAGNKQARIQLLAFVDGTPNACSNMSVLSMMDFPVIIESADAYCAAAATSVAYEYIDAVGLGDFTLTTCGCETYEFIDAGFPITAGESTSIALIPGFHYGSYSEYWGVWIDFNQDNDFDDAGEHVFAVDTAIPGHVSAIISIPAGAATGTTRMRVAMNFGGVPESCGTFTSGQVVDFTVDISPAYCTVIGNSTEEWIEEVGFSNATTGATTYNSGNNGGYADFTDEHTFFLAKNQWMYFSGTPGFAASSYAERWEVYIDFNQDGDFDDANENPDFYYATLNGIESQATRINDYIWIPSSALTGETRMRVVMSYFDVNSACNNISYGEIEDYTVFIGTSSGALQADLPPTIELAQLPKSYLTPSEEDGKRIPVQTEIETTIANNTINNPSPEMNIFPNPSKGLSTLQVELAQTTDAKIQVFASNGQQVAEYKLNDAQFIDTQIDITKEPAGTYFVHLTTANETISKQLLKVE